MIKSGWIPWIVGGIVAVLSTLAFVLTGTKPAKRRNDPPKPADRDKAGAEVASGIVIEGAGEAITRVEDAREGPTPGKDLASLTGARYGARGDE